MMTTKQLTTEIRRAFYGPEQGVRVTAENLAVAKRLKLGVICGRGGIDCRRRESSASAYSCGIKTPEIGDLLVWQCGQVG